MTEGSASSVSSTSTVNLAAFDIDAQVQELARLHQEAQDMEFAALLQREADPEQARQEAEDREFAERLQREVNAPPVLPALPAHQSSPGPLRHHFSRRATAGREAHRPFRTLPTIPEDELDECTMCFEVPVEPRACKSCKQIIGCKACIARWHRRNPSCPLCREKWNANPEVCLTTVVERRRRIRERVRAENAPILTL